MTKQTKTGVLEGSYDELDTVGDAVRAALEGCYTREDIEKEVDHVITAWTALAKASAEEEEAAQCSYEEQAANAGLLPRCET